RIEEPVLGVALDGVGFGTDGGAWGGELLRVDGADWHRVAHLVTLPLPGGDCAAREPWRLAAAALHRLGRGQEIAERFAREPAAARLAQILERGVCCPPTSSAGRVFDAAAALLGVAERSRFEAQAAMRLEALARRGVARDIERLWNYDSQDNLDVLPLLEAIADWHGRVEDGAALFHASFAAALADWIVRSAVDVGCVALCGGCLANGLLRDALGRHLGEAGLRVLHPIALPPNDGAISVGQAWAAIVAAEV
ncbi:MAG TPA: carbamoyltransferase HypF, partial [Steroidobacteraceae bacterium]|nr:carbamoyltransferase HypF [Steroidobacteraceae bacterium]